MISLTGVTGDGIDDSRGFSNAAFVMGIYGIGRRMMKLMVLELFSSNFVYQNMENFNVARSNGTRYSLKSSE